MDPLDSPGIQIVGYSNAPARMKAMEREIKILKDKIAELSQENIALREINVQFQLENFKLQQKLKNPIPAVNNNISLVTFNETSYETHEEEYLEEVETPRRKKPKQQVSPRPVRTKSKPSYEETYEEEEDVLEISDNLIKQESDLIEDTRLEESDEYVQEQINEPQSDTEITVEDEEESKTTTPQEATAFIYKIAARRGALDRFKAIELGRQKDSLFVGRALDLVFDRNILASSSASGKKPNHGHTRKPALDFKKLSIVKQAFVYRLRREGLSIPAREARLKQFNALVNLKVQNTKRQLKNEEEQKRNRMSM